MEIILKMSLIGWLIFWLSIVAHVPLVIGAFKNKLDKSQVFPTWFLYFFLDMITMFSSNKLDGSYVILFGFAVGSFVMALILLSQGRIGWSRLENVVTILIIFCIIAWYYSGPYWALIFGIGSESIVGIYLIIKTFINPTVKYNLPAYIIFLIVSIIALFDGKDWSLEQVGFPLCETILNIVIIIPLFRKIWINKGYPLYE